MQKLMLFADLKCYPDLIITDLSTMLWFSKTKSVFLSPLRGD
jgi:hypothetical protein